jgi:hypothetical protein
MELANGSNLQQKLSNGVQFAKENLLDFIIFYYKQAHLFLVPLVPLVF